MDLTTIGLLALAGAVSGAINAVAGGGTFITFGALSLVGVPPISANATSSIAQFPGYITSTLGYLGDIRRRWRDALLLCAVSVGGALVGAFVLLSLDNPSFRRFVPWLLVAATLLFALGPWLKSHAAREQQVPPSRGRLRGALVQFVTAVYGGFFGAGMGVMMLATLGLTDAGDYHHLNALKNLLSIVIAATAILVFTSSGVIAWLEAAVMIPAVAFGGYAGVWAARRVPQIVLRTFVIAIGLFLAAYYFLRT